MSATVLHLAHPAFVHFTVAFVIGGGVVEAWGLVADREAARSWGATLLLVGLASLVPTLASGYLADNTLDVSGAPGSLLAAHERNGWILLGLLFATQFWKAWRGGRLGDRERWIYVVAVVAAVALTAYNAWLGGRMVYGHGIGVL